MHKSYALILAAACGAASAQTPANNPMPDGSRDMYVGLGVGSAPEWDGARHHKLRALPVLQVQWSNGVFVSGMSAGIHLSGSPQVEFGPLLTVIRVNDLQDGCKATPALVDNKMYVRTYGTLYCFARKD